MIKDTDEGGGQWINHKYIREQLSFWRSLPRIPYKVNLPPSNPPLRLPFSNPPLSAKIPTCSIQAPTTINVGNLDPSEYQNPVSPDYITVSGSLSPIGSPVAPAVGVTVDRYSNSYLSFGANFGKSYITGYSGSVVGGYLGVNPMDNYLPTEQELGDFLTGLSVNASTGAGAGLGATYSPFTTGPNQIAVETGAYTPQAGATVFLTLPLQ